MVERYFQPLTWFACDFFILTKDSLLYHLACFGVDRTGNLRICAARLPFSRELNEISLTEADHFEISDDKGIIDSDAYTGLHATTIDTANSDFGDLHGIVFEPKVCPYRVDVPGGLMRLKWREEMTPFSPKQWLESLQRARESSADVYHRK